MLSERLTQDNEWRHLTGSEQHLRGDWRRRSATLVLGLTFTILIASWASYEGSRTRTGLSLSSFCFDSAGASGKSIDDCQDGWKSLPDIITPTSATAVDQSEEPRRQSSCRETANLTGINGSVSYSAGASTCRWLIGVGRGFDVLLNFSKLHQLRKSDSLVVLAANSSDLRSGNFSVDPWGLLVNISGGADRFIPTVLNSHSDRVQVIFRPGEDGIANAGNFSIAWEAVVRPLAVQRPAKQRQKKFVTLCQGELYDPNTCIRIDVCNATCGNGRCSNLDGACMKKGNQCTLKGDSFYIPCKTCALSFVEVPSQVKVDLYTLWGFWPSQKDSCTPQVTSLGGVSKIETVHGPTSTLKQLSQPACSAVVRVQDASMCA